MSPAASRPIRVALVDDYDVLAGVVAMFDRYQDHIRIVEIDARDRWMKPSTWCCMTRSRS